MSQRRSDDIHSAFIEFRWLSTCGLANDEFAESLCDALVTNSSRGRASITRNEDGVPIGIQVADSSIFREAVPSFIRKFVDTYHARGMVVAHWVEPDDHTVWSVDQNMMVVQKMPKR